MNRGFYAIFEGSDGSGKTTIMNRVAKSLFALLQENNDLKDNIILSHQPGSTPLGAHIRKLVKYPHLIDPNISIDNISRQMLYMVDAANFVKTLLEPALEDNKILFSDRSSYISSIVYGLADGCELREIEKIYDIVMPPKADKLIILQSPADICKQRIDLNRKFEHKNSKISDLNNDKDYYDSKPLEFFKKIGSIYDNLITTSPEITAAVSKYVAIKDIRYIDATLPCHNIVELLVDELYQTIIDRCFY